MSGTVECRPLSADCVMLRCFTLSTITYIYIIVAELKMRWSDIIIMVFIVTEKAGTPSRNFPVNKEKTLRRGVMKGN